jgi:hypothetical protein
MPQALPPGTALIVEVEAGYYGGVQPASEVTYPAPGRGIDRRQSQPNAFVPMERRMTNVYRLKPKRILTARAGPNTTLRKELLGPIEVQPSHSSS